MRLKEWFLMSRKLLTLLIIAVFIAGAGMGVLGHWYFADQLPRVRMTETVKKQQEQLNKMVRSGEVKEVKPDELTVNVTEAGDPQYKGKTITVKTDQYTSVQNGMDFVSKPGQPTDLTQHIKPGMHVDLLVNGDKAAAIHWVAQDQGQPVQVGQGQTQGQPSTQAVQAQKQK